MASLYGNHERLGFGSYQIVMMGFKAPWVRSWLEFSIFRCFFFRAFFFRFVL